MIDVTFNDKIRNGESAYTDMATMVYDPDDGVVVDPADKHICDSCA